jgi:hypothetical protein
MANQAWLKTIKRGDVLRSGTGTLRIVRHVTPRCVYFAIRHCSWTGRCYTIYFHNDLIQFNFKPTGKRVRLRKHIDKQIEQEIRRCTQKGKPVPPAQVKCCDVDGVP